MTYKYEPLEIYLRSKFSNNERISVTFAEIEEIVGSSIPQSAYAYREWWSNQSDVSNRSQAKAWINAGYRVENVQQRSKSGSVTFLRK